MKLSSDNKDSMPITDAVYGASPRRGEKVDQPRGHTTSLWRRIDQQVIDRLADAGKETKRLAARRRQGQ